MLITVPYDFNPAAALVESLRVRICCSCERVHGDAYELDKSGRLCSCISRDLNMVYKLVMSNKKIKKKISAYILNVSSSIKKSNCGENAVSS